MAHPRRIVPGETYLITRRCYQRTFRLRPSAKTNGIFTYCLALAMEKTGVLLHAACVMSNHHHLVVTDPNGVLPDFLRELHRLTAKAMNASQGEWENLWAAEPCNAVRLVTDGDVDDKIAYVVTNPVAAGLVEQPEKWPGVLAWGERVLRVRRPKAYFRDDGWCPAEVTLVVQRPGARDGALVAAPVWRDRVRRLIADKVSAAREAMRKAGRTFVGRTGVCAASFRQRAQSYEDKRGIVPRFSAAVRSVRERLRRAEQHFRRRYRAALDRWRGGEREIEFPFGTWGMRTLHAASVESVA